ncbi:MAG TPA: fibronectin type III domain-containing protein [Micromonosporaceae bacterium]|nr:fibronectin type III domain-containing protein [Micromonosporaceae bacterium]
MEAGAVRLHWTHPFALRRRLAAAVALSLATAGTLVAFAAHPASARCAPLPPDPPTGVGATAGNGEAEVNWTASTRPGCGGITEYAVTASPGGAGCTTDGETTCIVTGLTNGTAYTFTVVATNAIDSSDPSDPSDPVTPFAPPDSPTAVAGRPGDERAVVSWTAPADAGTGGITGYRATALAGGGHCGAGAVTACAVTARISPNCTTNGATTCTVTGLTNGTAYRFIVVASNAYSESPPSEPSDPVTPAALTAPALPDDMPMSRGTLRSSAGRQFSRTERTTTLVGHRFAPNSPVTLGLYSSPRVLTTAVTNSAGTFRVEVTIPAGFTGTHTFVAIGYAPDLSTRTLALAMTVDEEADLPATGPGLRTVLMLGLAMLAAGTALLVAGRRRRSLAPETAATGRRSGD